MRGLPCLVRDHVAAAAIVLAFLLGVGDLLTSIEITFTLLYLAPIALATWWGDRLLGYAVAIECVILAVTGEVFQRLIASWPVHPIKMAWNHGGSLLSFFLFVELLCRLRFYLEREAQARRATVEQLRQAERLGVVGKLAAGLAHELGTPLNVIGCYAEMIAGEQLGPSEVRSAANTIQGQTEKMSGIIRNLLDFSRTAGRERERLGVSSLVESASVLLRPVAGKARVEVSVDAGVSGDAPEQLFVEGNRTELEQVLLNVMLNGVQAMPHGGHLEVHLRRVELEGQAFARIEVEDEGVGIAPESLPKIFDPFYTTKDIGQGTGLGLSVSYAIVSDHGGRIEAKSRPREGSVFSLLLPLSTG